MVSLKIVHDIIITTQELYYNHNIRVRTKQSRIETNAKALFFKITHSKRHSIG